MIRASVWKTVVVLRRLLSVAHITKSTLLCPIRGVSYRAAGGNILWRGCILGRRRRSLSFHFLHLRRCGSSLDCADVCVFIIRPNYRSVSPVGIDGLAVSGWVWRCGGHAGLGIKTLKDVSKESVTDDLLVVVVSLDCESDEKHCQGYSFAVKTLLYVWFPYLAEERSAHPLLLQSWRRHPKPPGQKCQSAPSDQANPHSPPWTRCCQWGLQEERKIRNYPHFYVSVHLFTELPPVQLTSLVVSDTEVCRGQVDVHIMLEDLLEETLSLSQLELLRCIHIREPLASLGLGWQTQQTDRTLDPSSGKILHPIPGVIPIQHNTRGFHRLVPPPWWLACKSMRSPSEV